MNDLDLEPMGDAIEKLEKEKAELLVALKEAVSAHWNGVPYGAVPKWKAVIAKAEGK